MTPGYYIIVQTSAKCFRLDGYTEAEAREVFATVKPKTKRVIQLVKFTSHFSWCIIEEKRG